ncbi:MULTISPECIES: hypothetical protein [unclassified Candidatus Cardinium]|uniref:hypothetical protein n=1 Tax=unclassified Candidatus Cardinium TaxID=2641185 RepID=UPI001FB23086|nr:MULTISPECIES: hypothetical protein [unclassified Candidatus Cardinium]
MEYNWLLIALFFGIPATLCHAETNAGEIKDAEFVIEKKKKNRVNQAQRLFFKAPSQTIKNLHKPLAATKALTSETISFDLVPLTYLPFCLKNKEDRLVFKNYGKVGMSSLLLPYLEVSLGNHAFCKGIWWTHLTFAPELWNKKSTEASLRLQGRYGIGPWLLDPSLHYQHNWHKYSDTTHSSRLHQTKIDLLTQQASETATQDGQVSLKLLNDHHKKLNEQLFMLKYKWVKHLNNWSVKVTTYNDIASYTNHKQQQTRFIVSATPSLYLRLFKSIQLKSGLRMAYHNDPIPGKIPHFDLYPMVRIAYAVSSQLMPYIGIQGMGVGGSVVPLHLHHVVAKNPFIAFNMKLSHRHEYFKLYGGSKGIIRPNLSYQLDIAYRKFKNQSRIVAVTNNEISLAYHPDEYNVLKATGIVDYAIAGTKFNATIKGSYYRYPDNRLAPIWWYHKPIYKLKPTLTYKVHPKVLLISHLHLHGPTTVKDLAGTAMELDKIINLSLNIDFFISTRFTAFLMISNLLNRQHIGYTHYPDKKINITGGLHYKW